MELTPNQSVTKAKERVMVKNTAQTVVNENKKETVTTAGLSTHLRDAQHGISNVTSARKKGTFPNAAAPGLISHHSTGQGRICMTLNRSPMAILNCNRTLFKSSSLETT